MEKTSQLAEKVKAKVEQIVDPETMLTLGEMKLVQDVREIEEGVVRVDFSLTAGFCPMALPIALRIKETAKSVEGVKKVYVYLHGHAMEKVINEIVNKEE